MIIYVTINIQFLSKGILLEYVDFQLQPKSLKRNLGTPGRPVLPVSSKIRRPSPRPQKTFQKRRKKLLFLTNYWNKTGVCILVQSTVSLLALMFIIVFLLKTYVPCRPSFYGNSSPSIISLGTNPTKKSSSKLLEAQLSLPI